jgi:hypothetical protein
MKRIVLTALMTVVGLGTLAGVGTAAPVAVADPAASLQALRLELTKAQAAVEPLYAQRQKLEDEAQRLAASIDAAKKRREGVARDRALQTLLAQSKDKTDALEQVQAQLRWREPGLAELRRRVLRGIDAALDGRALPEATRLDLEHLRVATVAMLTSPMLPVQVVRDPRAAIDPLDGPRELREKADLLRDSGDKLRREVKRIAGRLDNVERRRHLRERSGALDEDLFGESTSNRRVARVGDSGGNGTSTSVSSDHASPTQTTGTGGAVNTAPGATPTLGSGQQPSTPTTGRTDTTTLRNLVDPATLDELERADSIDDTDRQARALKKAQTELESLANELDRRAQALDGRATQLKQQK